MIGVLLAALLGAVAPAPATGLDGPYDTNNPFAQILRDERKQPVVYEDARVLVFMPLGMVSPGHVLVIPKAPARNLLALGPEDISAVMAAVRKAAIAQRRALGATGFKVVQNNGASAGQSVFQVHFHVIPTYDGVKLKTGSDESEDSPAELEAVAAKLRAAWPH